jgi:hypothetical protein
VPYGAVHSVVDTGVVAIGKLPCRALANLGQRPRTGQAVRNDPGAVFDPGRPPFLRRTGTSDGKGATAQVGFADHGRNAVVTQFTPEDGTDNCVAVNYNDMAAIRQALK